MKTTKSFRQLERVAKGFANHRRIQIMALLHRQPGLSLDEIADELDVNFRTIHEHLRRLIFAGLVLKWPQGNYVRHKLTKSAESILRFLGTLE